MDSSASSLFRQYFVTKTHTPRTYSGRKLTREQILGAQRRWGDGIVAIAAAHRDGGDFVGLARKLIETLYAYGLTDVLFKPTLAAVEQFRPTFDSALSYFVASNNVCPEDKGFAINPWTKVRFENHGFILEEKRAIAMGNYFFTDLDGNEVKVEYTFGYKLIDGVLKIDLHHSSFPYKNS